MNYEGPMEYTQAMARIAQLRSEKLVPYLAVIGPGLYVGCSHEVDRVFSIPRSKETTQPAARKNAAISGSIEVSADSGELFSDDSPNDD